MTRIADQGTLFRTAEHLLHSSGRAQKTPDSLTVSVRRSIARGDDPLGDSYSRLVSPELRREQGATFTPPAVVNAMLRWARAQGGRIARVVDPGAGSGRFTLAAARAFPRAEIIAVEKDPDVARLLHANVAAARLTGRVRVLIRDYRGVELPQIKGRTLYIGNPPYVRHHDIDLAWKDWYAKNLSDQDLPGSRLAGLHLHFLLKTKLLAAPGDIGCFITAAEWLDVNYGSAARAMLTNGMGGQALHLIDKETKVFEDALTSAVITCFTVGANNKSLRVRRVRSVTELGDLTGGMRVGLSKVQASGRWSALANRHGPEAGGTIELGDLFEVHRGQVTGMNRVWVAGEQAKNLPRRVLVPVVTDAGEIIDAPKNRLVSTKGLKRLVALPADLGEFDGETRRTIDRFLRWAKTQGAHETYIARHRNPWWRVSPGEAAPIVMTYMARRPPVFVRNLCGARLLNIAHGLYPRVPMTHEDLDRMAHWLNANVRTSAGRTYAGGLTKFEPGEVEKLRIPDLEALRETELP